MADFKDEISGYTQNLEIMQTLQRLDLPLGKDRISRNLVTCYEALVSKKIIAADELTLLDAWLEDLSVAGFRE